MPPTRPDRPARAALLASLLAVTAALTVGTAPATAKAADGAVCNKFCDARDPQNATGDRTSVTASIYGRGIALHLSDNDVMGWASIDGAVAGDQVWLDRSFDGGRTWSSGSRLGATAVPAGATGWRSQMYNVDEWNTGGIGALRACGKAGNRAEISCTGWARTDWNAASRSTAAATSLMMEYHRDTGKFAGWWTSATALTSLIDNIRISGMQSYRYAISTTYEKLIGAEDGDFTNSYLDDTGWWGLAWVAAYDVTGDARYLETARKDADHMHDYWTSTCGGGVQWATDKPYKNAVTNELYLQLNASLHNRIGGDTAYLQRAEDEWAWFRGTGMINSGGTVNDGLTSACANNGDTTWTYNQGVILAGLAELHRATGDAALLSSARTLADASTSSGYLNPGGTLHEPYEPDGTGCTSDGDSFKGAYARGLGILDKELADHPYSGYLDRQAGTLYARNRNSLDQYGPHWAGPFTVTGNGCQHSALDLLNAAQDG
ncbi:glycoside hydrolase family 76 protein [Streptomyces sp. NBC_01260]|uniref:glycoside hydrolase family 76 protein n=1 Tax=Streptomyces sp. NBC_01260 TaxID=2903801 RepID=UPI002E31BFAF|nr:glycoside hydrolase family 76 protein [Streptomyces sp. NBC_01260]